VVSPVVAGGVLAAHALAYRITATPSERFHEYLAHAPQVLLLLTFAGIVMGGFGRSREAPKAHVFPLLAVTTFVLQEHLERVIHGGSFPILVTSRAFLVGLLLQIPFALVAWALARWLVAASGERPARRVVLRPRFELPLIALPTGALAAIEAPAALGRGPPLLLRPR
jgi:hypothetical protein